MFFFPCSNITCFTFLWPIYWLSLLVPHVFGSVCTIPIIMINGLIHLLCYSFSCKKSQSSASIASSFWGIMIAETFKFFFVLWKNAEQSETFPLHNTVHRTYARPIKILVTTVRYVIIRCLGLDACIKWSAPRSCVVCHPVKIFLYGIFLFFYFFLVGWDLTPIRSLCRSPRFV
jgi:hypothetical protein